MSSPWAGASKISCDTAPEIRWWPKGCSKQTVFPRLVYNGNPTGDTKTNLGNFWWHLYLAKEEIQKTYPGGEQRPLLPTIPGFSREAPLTRLIDTAAKRANYKQSIKYCKEKWTANYATGGNQCDEFPFQSTNQGSESCGCKAWPIIPISVRPIPADNNGAGGRILQAFYYQDRILRDTPFIISLVGSPGPRPAGF